jgi:hypothetical protein
VDLPNHILLVKFSIVQQKMIVGMAKALDENKHVQCDVQFVTKHVILTTAISAHTTSLVTGVARTFGVHHKNVMGAISRRMLMDANGFSLWSLFMRKESTNGLLGLVKEVVIDWWVVKSRISPNKSKVTRKRLEAMVYDEKPTHFLM